MQLVDERATRPRRANAGNRLQQLLQQGLDNEEEQVLRAFSDASSDTSFTTVSGEEIMDEIDSDFSDEQVIGVLEGQVVETEESVWREERKERRKAKSRLLSRSRHFTDQLANANKIKVKQQQHAKSNINNNQDVDNHKHAKRSKRKKQSHLHQRHHRHHHSRQAKQSQQKQISQQQSKTMFKNSSGESEDYSSSSDESNNDDDDDDQDDKSEQHDLRSAFRQRPAPTIPLAERMQAALQRAAQVRQAMRMQSVYTKDVDDSSNGNNIDKMSKQGMNYMHSFNMGKQTRVRRRRSTMYSIHNKNFRKHLQYDNLLNEDNVNNFHLGTAIDPLLLIQNRRVIAYTGHAPFQRVLYRSGRSILSSYGVPTIISFSHNLPPALQPGNRK